MSIPISRLHKRPTQHWYGEKHIVDERRSQRYPHIDNREGICWRVVHSAEWIWEERGQLVVSRYYNMDTGHLGSTKALACILAIFFGCVCPKIIGQFCQTYPECQLGSKRGPPKHCRFHF